MVIRIMLNPKSVDMEGVTTLAQAQAANEQLKQGIEERNRQAIAAWEARTGLKYDPEWREHVLRPDGPFREVDGSTIREGTIRNGEWDGEVREYRDGVLRKTAIYKNGSETGTRKLYRGDGTLALDRFFNEDGNAVEIHYGKDGKTEEYRLVLGKRKVLFDSRKQQAEQPQEAPAEPAAQPETEQKPSAKTKAFERVREPIGSQGGYMEGIKENGHWVGEVRLFNTGKDKLPAMIEHYDKSGRLEIRETMHSTDRSKVYLRTYFYADGSSIQTMYAPSGEALLKTSIDANGHEEIIYSRAQERLRRRIEEAKDNKYFPKESIDWELLMSDKDGMQLADDLLFYVEDRERQDDMMRFLGKDKKEHENARKRAQAKLREAKKKALAKQEELQKRRGQPGNTALSVGLREQYNPGGMEQHLKQKEAKPQPGLITIPPANTALSVGDLHTGARMAYGKPDSKFIGSGEGAQVFGWGHYSSNRKGVARDEYAMRYVKDFQKRSKVQHKGDPKSAVSIGSVVYDNVVDFAYEASRIEEALYNKLQKYERFEKDEEGNFVVGDKTVPKELLTFIAATRAALVDAQTVFSAWTGNAVTKDYRDPEFYRIARYRAKSEQDSVLPMSRFYGEMMLRGPLKSKKAWAAFVDTFFPKVERVIPEGPRPSVINQTWWTHRPKGDESHLLNWYEPLSEENWSRVLKTLEDLADEHGAKPYEMDAVFGRGWRDREVNGESAYIMVADFFRHMTESDYPEKDASEALYAHDIDGVKYPVDTFSNDDNMDGRLGWNYVAFSDEHLRVDSVEEWNPETDRFEPRPVPANTALSVGAPLEIPAASLKEAQAAIRILSERHTKIKMRNGDIVQFSAQSNKMHNSKAVHESDDADAHFAAVAAIKKICEAAEFIYDEPPRNGSPDIRFYRKYATPVIVNGQGYIAKLTAKVYPQEGSDNIAYSIEAISLERIGDRGINDAITKGKQHLDPIAIEKVTRLVNLVKSHLSGRENFGPRGANTAFSVGSRPGRAPTVEPGGDVREAGEGALAWLRRKFVHSQTPVFDAVRRVMGVGREPPDALNVEAAAKNVHGKIRARQEMLQRAYLEPLKAILAQPGMDRKRFDDYALALHALERNRMIQERSVVVDPTTGEVVDLGVEAGSGVTNAWAERVIREIQRDPFAAQYKEAANILAEMNRFVLRGAVADGLLTEAQARTWMRLSPHYVPLKSGGAAPGAIHKRATGRFTRPDSVLVNSMRQAYATVRNGELNRVNKTMADWIREYDPNGEQVGGTVPESHKHAKIKMADPQYVPKGSTAEALLRERGIRLVETEDKGGYWVDTGVLPNALKRVVRESVPQGDDIVTFWENGERKFIRFEGKRGRDGRAENEAARIADALNFKNVLHKEGRFWDAIRGLTRWKANVSTSWNPTFIVRNMGADVFNTANLMIIEGKYAELARTMRNYPEALRTIARLHSLRREAGDSEMERMFARCFCAVFCWRLCADCAPLTCLLFLLFAIIALSSRRNCRA